MSAASRLKDELKPDGGGDDIFAAEYVLGLVPRGTHHYDKLVRPSELAAWARNAGLTHTASSGVEYNPLTRRVRLSPNTDVNYMLAFRKL